MTVSSAAAADGSLVDTARIAETSSDFSQVLALSPDSERHWYNNAIAFGKLGRLDEAKESFGRAIELNPSFAEAYWNRILVWVRLRNFSDAASDLESYVRLVGPLSQADQAEARQLLGQAATGTEVESSQRVARP